MVQHNCQQYGMKDDDKGSSLNEEMPLQTVSVHQDLIKLNIPPRYYLLYVFRFTYRILLSVYPCILSRLTTVICGIFKWRYNCWRIRFNRGYFIFLI